MTSPPVKRKLAAILAADAVGYSRAMASDEEGTVKVLNAHRAVIDGIIQFHEGRIVNTAGDSVLAEFASPTQAVRCAVEIQDALKTRNDSLPEDRRMQFRIGVNLGDVMVKGDDLLGDGVNVAARLESIAEPGRHLCRVERLRPDRRQARPRLQRPRRAVAEEHRSAGPRVSRRSRQARDTPAGAQEEELADAVDRGRPGSGRSRRRRELVPRTAIHRAASGRSQGESRRRCGESRAESEIAKMRAETEEARKRCRDSYGLGRGAQTARSKSSARQKRVRVLRPSLRERAPMPSRHGARRMRNWQPPQTHAAPLKRPRSRRPRLRSPRNQRPPTRVHGQRYSTASHSPRCRRKPSMFRRRSPADDSTPARQAAGAGLDAVRRRPRRMEACSSRPGIRLRKQSSVNLQCFRSAARLRPTGTKGAASSARAIAGSLSCARCRTHDLSPRTSAARSYEGTWAGTFACSGGKDPDRTFPALVSYSAKGFEVQANNPAKRATDC
jgi:hypothetical protein